MVKINREALILVLMNVKAATTICTEFAAATNIKMGPSLGSLNYTPCSMSCAGFHYNGSVLFFSFFLFIHICILIRKVQQVRSMYRKAGRCPTQWGN